MHDTLTSAIVGIDRMDASAYLFFVCKMIGVIIVGISGILGAMVTIYKSCVFFWDRIVSHIGASLSKTFVTNDALETAMNGVASSVSASISADLNRGEDRFLAGDQRMERIESSLAKLPCLRPSGPVICTH